MASLASLSMSQTAPLQLGDRCGHDMDCTDSIKSSQCSMAGFCECKPFYAHFNETSCVQGTVCTWITFIENGVKLNCLIELRIENKKIKKDSNS